MYLFPFSMGTSCLTSKGRLRFHMETISIVAYTQLSIFSVLLYNEFRLKKNQKNSLLAAKRREMVIPWSKKIAQNEIENNCATCTQ